MLKVMRQITVSANYRLRLSGHYIEVCSPHQETPLHKAAYHGQEDTVRCLVDKGADVNIKNGKGVS